MSSLVIQVKKGLWKDFKQWRKVDFNYKGDKVREEEKSCFLKNCLVKGDFDEKGKWQ